MNLAANACDLNDRHQVSLLIGMAPIRSALGRYQTGTLHFQRLTGRAHAKMNRLAMRLALNGDYDFV